MQYNLIYNLLIFKMDLKTILLSEKSNNICFDCGLIYKIEYVSINNSVFLCKFCGDEHKKLNNKRISIIRSINDSWDEYLMLFIMKGGNNRLKNLLIDYMVKVFGIDKYKTKTIEYYRKLLKSQVLGDEPPNELPLILGNQIEEDLEEDNEELSYYYLDSELDIIYDTNQETYQINTDFIKKVKNNMMRALYLSNDILSNYVISGIASTKDGIVNLYDKIHSYLNKNKSQQTLQSNKLSNNEIIEEINKPNNNDYSIEINDIISTNDNPYNLIIKDYINYQISLKSMKLESSNVKQSYPNEEELYLEESHIFESQSNENKVLNNKTEENSLPTIDDLNKKSF